MNKSRHLVSVKSIHSYITRGYVCKYVNRSSDVHTNPNVKILSRRSVAVFMITRGMRAICIEFPSVNIFFGCSIAVAVTRRDICRVSSVFPQNAGRYLSSNKHNTA